MKNFVCLFFYLIPRLIFSQEDFHCGTDVLMRKQFKINPKIEQVLIAKSKNRSYNYQKINTSSFVIPVVFHVLHLGGPENISDAQVKDGLNILNRDFAKINSDTIQIIPEFKQLADSSKIQFALATLDPNGNCTNGIIHYYDTDTDWNENSATLYQYTWDPTKYLNVYIVRTITLSSGFGAAGYTYFPGSLSSGSPADAIVVLNNYFGSIGTGSPFLSRVLTHEAGHWLGLYHVFGYTNGAGVDCSGDDFINDTPTTPGYLYCPDASNPSLYQQCTPGISENYQNYMDYSYCGRMFTQEQCYAMQTTLFDNTVGRDNLWSNTNLVNTGVTNTITCVPNADFKSNRIETCVGTPVLFTDASTNAIATTYTWTFSGGNPSVSNLASPSVTYNTPGFYSVSYKSASSAGTSSLITKTNYIQVVNNTATFISPLFEGFETTVLPNNNWKVYNTNGSVNWQQSSDASYSGSFCAKLPSDNNTRLASTSFVSPLIDLSSLSSPMLSFKLAASESNTLHVNNLKVLVSTDCENTWSQLYSKTGNQLITSTFSSNPFIPVSLNEWRQENISLNSVVGNSSVKFKFIYTRDTLPGAVNVFIDDINISGSVNVIKNYQNTKVSIYPIPAKSLLHINTNNFLFDKITISNVLGQIETIVNNNDNHEQEILINVGENTKYKPGIYFICIESKNGNEIHKLIIE
jgi:PKD repeat protein